MVWATRGTVALLVLLTVVVGLFFVQGDRTRAVQLVERVEEFPKDFELYPRDLETNMAVVNVSGVAEANSAQVTLDVSIDDVNVQSLTIDVDADGRYELSASIAAELTNYDFTLASVNNDGSRIILSQATNVVAGDIIVINGQSNAVSGIYQAATEDDTNQFVRTFGGWGVDSWVSDTSWSIARRDCVHGVGCVGQWGLRFGKHLALAEQVPIAVINGARGGRPIGYFQRNDGDQNNLTTNYGRLLTRLEQADVSDKIRAIVWYQGESDEPDHVGHISGFGSLYDDWRDNYPSVERTFVIQIRNACINRPGAEISNAQRDFAAERDNVTAISTTALSGHDGCHYRYVDGYRELGDNVARIVRAKMYRADLDNADAAAVTSAYVSSPTTIDIRFTSGNQLVADLGFHRLFVVRSDGAALAMTTGEVAADGQVRLTLSQPLPDDTSITIDYVSPAGSQSWITNSAGIGILTFLRVPVDRLGPPGDVNCDLATDDADTQAILEFRSGLRVRSNECPLPSGTGHANTDLADLDRDGVTGLGDALIVTQCTAGVANAYCS